MPPPWCLCSCFLCLPHACPLLFLVFPLVSCASSMKFLGIFLSLCSWFLCLPHEFHELFLVSALVSYIPIMICLCFLYCAIAGNPFLSLPFYEINSRHYRFSTTTPLQPKGGVYYCTPLFLRSLLPGPGSRPKRIGEIKFRPGGGF